MRTSPSCTRILQPWPIHDHRPSTRRAPGSISSVTPGPTKHIPSVTSRLRNRSLSQPSRSSNRAYLGLSMPWARIKRSSASAPPWRGGGSPRTAAGTASISGGDAATGSTPRRLVAHWCDDAPPMAADPDLARRLIEGDKRALARGISLVEDDDPAGWDLVREVFPRTGRASVVGFTGPPGVGKSTLIGALTKAQRAAGRDVAVLSVDPSSPFTRGALLGDRIRLSEHFLDPGVFIRSMANRGALGGLSEAALQAALLMDAAGKDDVFVETVGVGQAEVDIIDHADTIVLVLQPGSGDSIQALKAGVMEIPDVIVVNKADHPLTDTMLREVRGVLGLGPKGDWDIPVLTAEAAHGKGVEELAEALAEHREHIEREGTLSERRRRNLMNEVLALATARLRRRLEASVREDADVQHLLDEVVARRLDPASAAGSILERDDANGAAP